MGAFYSFIRFLFVGAIKTVYKIHIINQNNEDIIPEGGFIICSNHISAMDPLTLCCALRKNQPYFMAKAELFKIPVLAQFLRAIGAYPVDRGGSDVGAIRRAISLINEGHGLAMFPQGTRYPYVHPRETQTKQGVGLIAARSKANILPILIVTENFKMKLFQRTNVIIGEPILFTELNYDKSATAEYNRISQLVFERICELESNYAK